jgi:hypothetical protein
MRNYSGHVLAFGENAQVRGALNFEIETPGMNLAPRICKESIMLGVIIKPGGTYKFSVPISRYYKLTELGKYRIRAFVEHSQFDKKYQSNSSTFTVHNGTVVWERIVGVPDFTGKSNKIKSRKYKIVTSFDGKHKIIYLQIDDDEYIYVVKRIGYEAKNEPPTCEIDGLNRLNILVQASATVYVYFVFDIDGKLEKKVVYKKSITLPTLVRNDETGAVMVSGGKEAKKDFDYKDDPGNPFEN